LPRLYVIPYNLQSAFVEDRRDQTWNRYEITAAHIDLLGKRERHRIAFLCCLEVAIGGDNHGHRGALPRRTDQHPVAAPHDAARHRSGITAEVEMWPVNPLHWKAEWLLPRRRADIDSLKMSEQGGPVIPVHMRAWADHVIAFKRGDRDGGDQLEAERRGEVCKVVRERLKTRRIEVDEIHFVDGKRDLLDAKQRENA